MNTKKYNAEDGGVDGTGPPPPTFADVARSRLSPRPQPPDDALGRTPTPRTPLSPLLPDDPPPLGPAKPIPIPVPRSFREYLKSKDKEPSGKSPAMEDASPKSHGGTGSRPESPMFIQLLHHKV
jgi:hypothetical protein